MEPEEKKQPNLAELYAGEQKRVEELRKLAYSLMPQDAVVIIEKAKQSGIQPYTIQVGDDFFVYRTISRLEYKTLLVEQAQQAEQLMANAPTPTVGRVTVNTKNEDALVLRCTLYPEITALNINQHPAGAIETLNNAIMASSGFGQEPIPIKL